MKTNRAEIRKLARYRKKHNPEGHWLSQSIEKSQAKYKRKKLKKR